MNTKFNFIVISILIFTNKCMSAPSMDYEDMKAEESLLLKRKELNEEYWAKLKEVIMSLITGLGFILDLIKLKAIVPIVYILNLLDNRFKIVNILFTFIFQKCSKHNVPVQSVQIQKTTDFFQNHHTPVVFTAIEIIKM